MNKEMDRLIVVVYFNVSDIPSSEVNNVFKRWSEILGKGLTEEDLLWFIPRREGKTEVEIINRPILVTDEDYKKELEQKIKSIQEKLDDRLKDKKTE